MLKLFLLWLVGKTIRLNIHDIIGNYMITNVRIEKHFDGVDEISIDLEDKKDYLQKRQIKF
jgi:hypothetical protein